jgi:hypothetical protein
MEGSDGKSQAADQAGAKGVGAQLYCRDEISQDPQLMNWNKKARKSNYYKQNHPRAAKETLSDEEAARGFAWMCSLLRLRQ